MNGIVQAKLLGGFGNQLHQYAATRKYAELIGAKLEVEDWVGGAIFGLNDPTWSGDMPEMNDGSAGTGPTLAFGQTNVRLGGYFQTQRWVGLLSRQELRAWFTIRPELLHACARVRVPRCVAHLRRGDYVGHPLYCTVLESSYERAARTFGFEPIDEYMRQESPRLVHVVDPRYSFLPDFLTMMRASVLLRANSTFSWWAAVLGDADVYSPVVEDRVGEHDVDFVRGNWPRCAHPDRVGVQVDDLYLPD